MNSKFIGLAVLLLMASFVFGCSQTQQNNNAVVDNTPNHTTPWETGIAGATVYMSSAEVISKLGQPDFIYSDELKYYDIAHFSLNSNGNVSQIVQHYYIHSSYSPTNIGGISVKSTSAEVLAAYGNPDEITVSGGSIVSYSYEYFKDSSVQNDVGLLIFFFPDDTVHSIYIRR